MSRETRNQASQDRADVWFTRCPVPTAFGLAAASGELARDLKAIGVELRSLATSQDPTVRVTHFTQRQPRGFRHGGNIPPLVAASRGARVSIVGLSVAPSNAGLLALPSSGIDSPRALAGKTIGVARRIDDPVDFWRASALQAVERALEAAGLDASQVRIQEIPVQRTFVADSTSSTQATANLWDSTFMLGFQREEIAALLSREVDVIFSEGSGSIVTRAITGATVVYDAGATHPESPRSTNLRPLTLSVDTDLLESEPEVVDAVVKATRKAAVVAARDRSAAIRALAAEVGVPEELLVPSFSETLTSELDIDLSDYRIRLLEEQLAHLVKHGFITRAPSLARLIETGPLERVHASL
jgi:ABC-type nitrate/sulfonate/bicarbonate transport system substrate-binding protein